MHLVRSSSILPTLHCTQYSLPSPDAYLGSCIAGVMLKVMASATAAMRGAAAMRGEGQQLQGAIANKQQAMGPQVGLGLC